MSLNEYPKTEEVKSNPQNSEESISYDSSDVINLPSNLDAVIVSVDKKMASEVFGKENLKGGDREVLHILYENKEYGITNHETIGHFPKGKVPDRSKLAKFIKRYGKLEPGVTVNLYKNSEGFYKLIYD